MNSIYRSRQAIANWTWFICLFSLLTRLIFISWASARFSPVFDAIFFDKLAKRLAMGQGYTWVWPDQSVSYSAHYPVGYPAMLGGFYFIFGASLFVGMLPNAFLGMACTYSVLSLTRRVTSEKKARIASFVAAFHPALFLYVPALMTELLAVSLLVLGSHFSLMAAEACILHKKKKTKKEWYFRFALGLTLGLAVFVRPQYMVLIPFWAAASFPWMSPQNEGSPSGGARVLFGRFKICVFVVFVCCFTVLPWTVRNCIRLQRCTPISANGGWNLLVGVQSQNGVWSEMMVPETCKNIWAEGEKDICFALVAKKEILSSRDSFLIWVKKVPKKWAATFDYFGAAPWYLHESNPTVFNFKMKQNAGAVETLISRLNLAAAMISVRRMRRYFRNGGLPNDQKIGRLMVLSMRGSRTGANNIWEALWFLAFVFVFLPYAYVTYLYLAFASAQLFWTAKREILVIPGGTIHDSTSSRHLDVLSGSARWQQAMLSSLFFSACIIFFTALIHGLFFGAGRYGLVLIPYLIWISFFEQKGTSHSS